ncbi:hypothetical protein [Lysobacter sp. HA35]
MRLAPPPPDVRVPWRPAHAALLRALALATTQVQRHEHALSLALADDPGAIDLPAGAPNAMDAAQLRAAGPLYFAAELEIAGLLRCAELVAGLFASGAITQPLGPVAQSINAFWRGRRDRLQEGERQAVFNRVIEQPHFDRLMTALCRAITAQADNADDTGVRPDLREHVGLASCASSMAEFIAQRMDSMASIAVRDVIDTINVAIGFLRDRMLQVAFGTQSLWALIATASSRDGTTPRQRDRRAAPRGARSRRPGGADVVGGQLQQRERRAGSAFCLGCRLDHERAAMARRGAAAARAVGVRHAIVAAHRRLSTPWTRPCARHASLGRRPPRRALTKRRRTGSAAQSVTCSSRRRATTRWSMVIAGRLPMRWCGFRRSRRG